MDLSNITLGKRALLKILKPHTIKTEEYLSQINSEILRKKKGIYYTPEDITAYICFQTLSSYISQAVDDKEKDLFEYLTQGSEHDLRQVLQHLQTVKILDPACGAGVFLIEAAQMLFQLQKYLLERLNEPLNEFELKQEILLYNIYGVDLFEDAVETTKTRLLKWLTLGLDSDLSLNSLDANIRLGNSLIGWLDEDLGQVEHKNDTLTHQKVNHLFINSIYKDLPQKNREFFLNEMDKNQPFHWRIDFKSIMETKGFDIIVGNPPYVFIRGKNFSQFEREFYKEKYLKNYESLAKGKARQSRKINSFALFLIRSMHLLKPGGHLGFIIPNTILRTTTNDFIRQFIIENTYITEIVDLQAGIFKGITASTILLFLQKIQKSVKQTLIHSNVNNLLTFEYDSHFIDQTRFYNNPVLAFNIHLDPDFEKTFSLMKKDTFKLGDIAKEIIEGIVCRKKDNLFTNDPTHPLAKKMLRGKDIGRYQINWRPNQYILYAVDTSLTPTKLHRPRPQWVHEAPEKFITQRIGGGLYPIKVALDNSQYYTFASINNIIFKSPLTYDNQEYLPKYLLGILNSKLINAYYLLNFSNLSSQTVNISKTFLQSLPIKKVALPVQVLISRLSDYLLFLYQFPEKASALCNFFDSWLLDSLVYELYLQPHLKTNLTDILPKCIPAFPLTASEERKLKFFFQLMLNIQKEPPLLQILSKIKHHPEIQRIEFLFQKRSTFLKTKPPESQ